MIAAGFALLRWLLALPLPLPLLAERDDDVKKYFAYCRTRDSSRTCFKILTFALILNKERFVLKKVKNARDRTKISFNCSGLPTVDNKLLEVTLLLLLVLLLLLSPVTAMELEVEGGGVVVVVEVVVVVLVIGLLDVVWMLLLLGALLNLLARALTFPLVELEGGVEVEVFATEVLLLLLLLYLLRNALTVPGVTATDSLLFVEFSAVEVEVEVVGLIESTGFD